VHADPDGGSSTDPVIESATQMIEQGRGIFRFDTFGDEAFWGDALKLHQAIAGEQLGGVGAGVSPVTALRVGLKVDIDALPESIIQRLEAGTADLKNPATTLALLRLNAVVGVKGFFDAQDNLESIGIHCALCHSTVDDSFSLGIGSRLDGWANRDLNVGAIIALAPDLTPFTELLQVDEQTVLDVLAAWGPGKFDATLTLDGKGFRPDGQTAAVLIPPMFGLAGVNLHTATGWGSVTYWNAFVAILEMHGQGTFFDPRLDDEERFPVAARWASTPSAMNRTWSPPNWPPCTSISLPSKRRPRRPAALMRRRPPAGHALSRQGRLCKVPRSTALHGAGLEHAHAGGDRSR